MKTRVPLLVSAPLALLLLSTATTAQFHWDRFPVERFTERYGFAAAVEPGTSRILIVGGGDFTNARSRYSSELIWENPSFRAADDPGLPGLRNPAITFDSTRDELLLFGGYESTPRPPVLRVWQNGAWQIRSGAVGPSERAAHVFVHDPVRGVSVLFGGRDRNDDKLGDTWLWDGTSWRQGAAGGPSPRDHAAAAFDPGSGRVVLFGGRIGSRGQSDETWALDANGWTLLATGGPAARFEAAMAFDPIQGELLLQGGQSWTSLQDDTWALPPGATSWSRRDYGSAGGRVEHQLLTDPSTGRLVALGGEDLGTTMSAHELTPTGWQRIEDPTPMPRLFHTMTLDERRDTLVVVGGLVRTGFAGSIHEIRDGNWRKIDPGAGPGPLRSHCASWDPNIGEVLVFGGIGAGGQPLGGTWSWDGTAWTDRSPGGPAPTLRFNTAMARDVHGTLILFGGADSPTTLPFSDTWRWDGSTWTRLRVSGPSGRSGHKMVYDPVRGETVLLGGTGVGGQGLNEAWIWDGSAWSQAPVPQVPPITNRLPSVLVTWDPRRERVATLGSLVPIWEWDGQAWSSPWDSFNFLPVDPGSEVAYAPWLDRLFAFGSPDASQNLEGTTLILEPDSPAAVETRFIPCGGITLRADNLPLIGRRDCSLTVGGAPAGTPVFLGLDATTGSAPPLDGCETALTLLFDIDLGVMATTAGARFVFPIPDDTALRGLEVAAMGFRLAAGGPVFGQFELTESVILTLGD